MSPNTLSLVVLAGLSALVEMFKKNESKLRHQVELVAYTLEEPPFFATDDMGSVFHARSVVKEKTKIALFMSTGFGAALVGVIQTMLYNGAQTGAGQSFVFNSVIAVVIGGVLLNGGYGSVVGIILGTFTFAIVNQGIYYTGWNSDWAGLILGILLFAAVIGNNTFRRLALGTGANKKQGS